MEEYKGKMGWDGSGEEHFGPGRGDGGSSRASLKTCDPSPLELPGPKADALQAIPGPVVSS